MRALLYPIVAGGALMASPAMAQNEAFEFWLNPSISTDLDEDTGIELETAQRFRSSEDGRVDTYFTRLWLNQDISENFTLSGAVERRINDGGSDETRLMQQLSGSHGILRTRLRLEQRFIDNADRMGLRLRPRLGVSVPINEQGRWSAKADAELFWTLRGNNIGSDEGITGLRTQVGLSYDVNDNLSVGLVYLRQQDFEDGGPDEIGHAPLISIEHAF
ncbi:DUF2490 domain-containing protein [Pelagerythrobacter aerophilus]|jgi:hypothetical protein|uniref:DUF2490 domain-containing protein n=1 Tax=Pelagerythrobacter aerophilus TaxID=2306995 RepID=A0A418NKJ6_9SPHN|nr:DUF2490 domain-containing protein [Pelagerythrobacter aerophilus]RIV79956.1 DUF2490 domain-containing protein [Pelagerythrobacter aerophilus]